MRIKNMEKWVVAAKKADFNLIGRQFHIDPVIARLIRNRGVRTLPIYVRSFPGRSENHNTAAKNRSENTQIIHFAVTSLSIIGRIPTENEVDAQRGIAKNGPMVRYKRQVKK